ncbi:ribbon-helix-helix domain-containing protein [bacterium]|nr:ribbon-helix-helix domain-containing protein [bacterium]
MSVAKITISMEQQLLEKIDQMVKNKAFGNRSQAIQSAVKDKINKLEHTRLAKECAKLDMKYEQDFADEGLIMELDEWPEY